MTVVVEGGAEYVVATYCPECCFANPSFGEWVTNGSKRNLVRIEVTEPVEVCRDCGKPLPPGSNAWERWTCIFDPDGDAAYWDEASAWAEEIPMRDDEEKGDNGPAEQGRRRVRMHFEHRADDADEVCQLVGRFRRKAREQGWTEEAIEWATRGVTATPAAEQLGPHVEPASPEPLTWRTQFERTLDYVEGARVLDHDQAADFRPLRFLVRGFWLALRGGT